LAGGLVLATVAAAGIMSSAFSGVLVPTQKTNTVVGSLSGMPGFAGNAGFGNLVSCLNASTQIICAPGFNYGSVMYAFQSAGSDGTSTYSINDISVLSGASFSAGLVGFLDQYADMDIPIAAQDLSYTTVGLQVNATCTQNLQVGSNAASGSYTYLSQCESGWRIFGNTTDRIGTYSAASGCAGSNYYSLEYVVAGAQVAYLSGATLELTPRFHLFDRGE
jgi:hypothetical protein